MNRSFYERNHYQQDKISVFINVCRMYIGMINIMFIFKGKTIDATTKWSTGQSRDFITDEKLHPAGFSAGGESINRAFEERLTEILGREFIKHLLENELPLWIMFMGEFEVKKKNFSKDNESILLCDSSVSNLAIAYNKWAETSLADVFEASSSGIHLDRYGRLILSKQFVTELFEETVVSITHFIEVQLGQRVNGKQIEAIYLAGGFASSIYLQQRVRDVVGNRAVVVIPKYPEQGVLQGAILYSRSHQSVATHKADSNYGVITTAFQNEEGGAFRNHLIESGATILKGNTYSRVYQRNELVNENMLCVHRDGKEFMQFKLEAVPNIIQHRKPTAKVYFQVIQTKEKRNIFQATVIDEITQECHIKRKELQSKYLVELHSMTHMKKVFVLAVLILIAISLLSHPIGVAFALMAIVYLGYEKILMN